MTYPKPLLLAGGRSSRMGTRKELLYLDEDEPMYKRLLSIVHAACPEANTAYLSLRNPEAAAAILEDSKTPNSENILTFDANGLPLSVNLIYDHDNAPGQDAVDIGPAAGLLAAHHHDPTATWLVAACDYPFITTGALQYLLAEGSGDDALVTCFSNTEGFCEPLLGVWRPEALGALSENVRNGILGPSAVVKRLGKMVQPVDERWLFNTNNPGEWKRAVDMITRKDHD